MTAIIAKDEFEKSLIVLALRQMASNEFTKAVAYLEAGSLKDGQSAMTRGETAKAIADRIG